MAQIPKGRPPQADPLRAFIVNLENRLNHALEHLNAARQIWDAEHAAECMIELIELQNAIEHAHNLTSHIIKHKNDKQ